LECPEFNVSPLILHDFPTIGLEKPWIKEDSLPLSAAGRTPLNSNMEDANSNRLMIIQTLHVIWLEFESWNLHFKSFDQFQFVFLYT
jgi:hypothetical protein